MPSSITTIINLSTEYVRYENAGASVSYYGYTDTFSPVLDNDPVFSIKKTFYNGSTLYSLWADSNTFDSIWTDRASYFATPSNITTITSTYSFDGSKNNIKFNWTSVAGVTKYLVTINGGPYNTSITYLPDALSSAVLNPEHKSPVLTFVNQTNCLVQNVATGSTYYITVQPSNNYGTCTASSGSITI